MRDEGICRAQTKGKLVGRAALDHQWRVGRRAGQPLIFNEAVRRPLLIEEIFHLASGAVRIETTVGVIDRQRWQTGGGRAHGLVWRYAEIGTDSRSGLCCQPRPGGKAELSGRNDRVHEQIASHAGFAAKALSHFAAQPQPLRRPVLGKGACLHRKIDVTQTIERFAAGGITRPSDLYGGADFDLTKIEDGESETVARPEIFRGRSNFANAEQRTAG